MTVLRSFTKPYKLGVALSGGGARGFAHVGALKAIESCGLRPDIIAGVSAGSIVSVLYAAGVSTDDMLDLFSNAKFSDFAELSVPKDGFFKLDKFKKFILKAVKVHNLEDLNIPTVVCATDIDHGCRVAFTEGPIGERIIASCSIPIVFKPVKIHGTNYVDGGVLHNLPAWAIRNKCRRLIGINCSPLVNTVHKNTLIDIAHRTYNLMAKTNAIPDMELCDLAVETRDIASYRVFNLKEIKRVYQSGFDCTIEALRQKGWIK